MRSVPPALQVGAPLGEGHLDAAAVARARTAFHQSGTLDLIDEAGGGAAAQGGHLGEVVHSHRPAGKTDLDQHLVPGHRQAVGGLEVGVERLHHPGMDMHQSTPGTDAGVVDHAGHRATVPGNTSGPQWL